MQASCVVVLVNVALMAMQFVAGGISGSNAMLADGAHTLIDVLGDGAVAAAIFFDGANRFGRQHKLTPIATVLVNLLILATGAELLFAGVLPVAAQPAGARPAALAALAVAVASVTVRMGLWCYLRAAAAQAKRRDSGSIAGALNASAWHACADSVASGVAAVGATGVLAGFPAVDRSGTALIGLLLIMAGLLQNAATLRSLLPQFARMNWSWRPYERPGPDNAPGEPCGGRR
ncbi:cation transporter [Paraburkholderia sp. J10-1]|uniref:cation transporter n=1 Tax=Paraburkholderia sp. J10-1 TaxID=2805430 RepID=UPI002AB714F2|nr:cation transporter [Paraburkholderia sp. J10-1]